MRRCRIESSWHVEIGDGRKVNMIVHSQELGDLVLCAYSSDRRCQESAGVFIVDSRQGDIIHDVALRSGTVTARGEAESVVYMDVSRHGGHGVRVVCVTSKALLWSFMISLENDGGFKNVIHIECSNDLLLAMENEESPMEDIVLRSMSVKVQPAERVEDSVLEGPEFIKESGYRGHRKGYTYWEPKNGRHGYYRNDRMHSLLQETMKEHTADNNRGIFHESERILHKAMIRCFLRLPKLSQYVLASNDSEDGMVYVGKYRDISQDGTIEVEATCESGLIGHLSGVLVLAASPDERFVASGSYDQTIRIWDTKSWQCIKILKGHGGGIKCLSFTHDGSMIISASSDNTIRVWSTSTWMCMRHLHGRHEDATWPVSMAIYEPENSTDTPRFLLSGSNGLFGGSTLKIFDVSSGDCLATFAQLRYDHKGSCSAVCITHDTRIITAATDSTLAGWDCSFFVEKKKPMLKGGFFG